MTSRWDLDCVKAREAYAMLPRRADRPEEVDWREIEVAVIDTGLTRHGVFAPWNDDEDDIVRLRDGLDLLEPGRLPLDPLGYKGNPGHGTRVASVLSGQLPGTYLGVAPGLPVVPYRAVDCVVLSRKSHRKRVAAAIRHAVDVACCEVVSMSLGFPALSIFGQRHLGEAVDHAYDCGVIMVGAGGQFSDRVCYPGKFARVIGAGGVRPDRRAYERYSEGALLRTAINVWAPADRILRANSVLRDGQVGDGELGEGDGTSFATVHVAAAAAMWLAFHGEALDGAYPEPWQRIEAFRLLIGRTSQPLEGDYWPTKPRGILDIAALLSARLPARSTLKYEKRVAARERF
jgi:hypothetical protein